jgi:hypothetical protein
MSPDTVVDENNIVIFDLEKGHTLRVIIDL